MNRVARLPFCQFLCLFVCLSVCLLAGLLCVLPFHFCFSVSRSVSRSVGQSSLLAYFFSHLLLSFTALEYELLTIDMFFTIVFSFHHVEVSSTVRQCVNTQE